MKMTVTVITVCTRFLFRLPLMHRLLALPVFGRALALRRSGADGDGSAHGPHRFSEERPMSLDGVIGA